MTDHEQKMWYTVQTWAVLKPWDVKMVYSRNGLQTVGYCKDEVEIITAHFPTLPKVYTSYPNLYSILKLMSRKYSIFADHVQRILHLYYTHPKGTTYLQHLSCPCPVCTPSLLYPMSCQNTTSPVHYQSEYHLYYVCHIIPSLLPLTHRNTTCMFCQFTVITPFCLAMSYQYTIFPDHFQS